MSENSPLSKEVGEFIEREMDTVPHLEALLLLWNSRPKGWSAGEMAASLYVSSGEARWVLQGLARRGLTARGADDRFSYRGDGAEQDALIEAVDTAYRRQVVRISRMIHAKAPAGLREFADAFRFTKTKDKD